MKTLHTLLAGVLLVAFTTVTFANEGSTNSTRWVAGFTDDECTSTYMLFSSLAGLIDFHGKKDNNGTKWNFGSYIYLDDPLYECHVYNESKRETVAIGNPAPKTGGGSGGGGSGGGGGGGGSGGETKEPPNPGENFTEKKHNELKSCWEEKAQAIASKLTGWDEIEQTGLLLELLGISRIGDQVMVGPIMKKIRITTESLQSQ